MSLELLLISIELGVLGFVVWRSARALRRAREHGAGADPLEQFQAAALELVRHPPLAEIVAGEIAVFYYALFAWRAHPHVPPTATAFTHHDKSGMSGIVLGFLFLLAIEGFAVHVLLSQWNTVVAWVFTASTIYAALWLLADYRATVLRPILVDDTKVTFRAGLRATVRVPRDAVAAVEREKPEFGKECYALTLLTTPETWVVLREPVTSTGMYGFKRRVRALGVEPDEAPEFVRSLVGDESN